MEAENWIWSSTNQELGFSTDVPIESFNVDIKPESSAADTTIKLEFLSHTEEIPASTTPAPPRQSIPRKCKMMAKKKLSDNSDSKHDSNSEDYVEEKKYDSEESEWSDSIQQTTSRKAPEPNSKPSGASITENEVQFLTQKHLAVILNPKFQKPNILRKRKFKYTSTNTEGETVNSQKSENAVSKDQKRHLIECPFCTKKYLVKRSKDTIIPHYVLFKHLKEVHHSYSILDPPTNPQDEMQAYAKVEVEVMQKNPPTCILPKRDVPVVKHNLMPKSKSPTVDPNVILAPNNFSPVADPNLHAAYNIPTLQPHNNMPDSDLPIPTVKSKSKKPNIFINHHNHSAVPTPIPIAARVNSAVYRVVTIGVVNEAPITMMNRPVAMLADDTPVVRLLNPEEWQYPTEPAELTSSELLVHPLKSDDLYYENTTTSYSDHDAVKEETIPTEETDPLCRSDIVMDIVKEEQDDDYLSQDVGATPQGEIGPAEEQLPMCSSALELSVKEETCDSLDADGIPICDLSTVKLEVDQLENAKSDFESKMANSFLSSILPKQVPYKIMSLDYVTDDGNDDAFLATVRLKIETAEGIKMWIEEFERSSHTNWIVGHTYPNVSRIQYKKEFICHRSKKNKKDVEQDDRPEQLKLNSECRSRLTFVIKKNTVSVKRRDKLVCEGYLCQLNINWNHNHKTGGDVDSLQKMKINPQIRADFHGYFEMGLAGSKAREHHIKMLRLKSDFDEELTLADASVNPKASTIYKLYDQWKKTNHHDVGNTPMMNRPYWTRSAKVSKENVEEIEERVESIEKN